MNKIETYLDGVRRIAIAGHVNPDGDCVGSCLGMYLYLKDNHPELSVDLYLQRPKEALCILTGIEEIKTEVTDDTSYDLMILLDISSKERVGVAGKYLTTAKKLLCLDHHVTNTEEYTWLINIPEASSTAEVVWKHLHPEKVSKACAQALYTGIVHDTGVFQYSNTSPETLRIAAALMEKEIGHTELLERTYFEKTYEENQVLGRALLESFLLYDGKVIISVIKSRTLRFYGITEKQMDGIVEQLRNTQGVEVAVFMYEKEWLTYKVSLRSKHQIDVSKVAKHFGGGGHVRAAGCTCEGMHRDVINNISDELYKQFQLLEEK